ncbi:hypothetical protein [Aliiglaciecola lipolytica]|uniref:DUF4175 domain-containing protein n=1 Tax=Aliiglaciecola lipolytica E3 TaxID=1127673 RepID=K6Y7S3_9ALTE|nr:hypothetical protein [Aliiglaciecola lipolytica]GAC14272.1 hypothetical protein GLIP_1639 [Aliiglaciecola lipolytica E3]
MQKDGTDILLNQLAVQLKTAKTRFIYHYIWQSIPLLITLSGLVFLFTNNVYFTCFTALCVTIVRVTSLFVLKLLKRFNLDNYLLYLNQQFSELEHSAQLLSRHAQLNPLQQLQKDKIQSKLQTLFQYKSPNLTPMYSNNRSILASLLVSLIIVGLVFVDPVSRLSSTFANHDDTSTTKPDAKTAIIWQETTITPPSYTGLASQTQNNLDLATIANSKITWQFKFNHSAGDKYIHISTSQAVNTAEDVAIDAKNKGIKLEKRQDGVFSITHTFLHSSVYYIRDDNGLIGGVHSVMITQDIAPKIRILTPKQTISTFAKSSSPVLEAEVHISDDFGISNVDILASVAKGSGEAVKFRDQVFSFDEVEMDNSSNKTSGVHKKTWNLIELGMEPGDELYFTIRAQDNKLPINQTARSETKIIKWLEDEQDLLMSEGMLIDFIPEYFKSQRQIIIETQQLIADTSFLSEEQFTLTSRSLGHAQSDLKTKYGQYLGDEFDDGSGNHGGDSDAGVPEVHVKDGDHNDDLDKHDDTPQRALGSHENNQANSHVADRASPHTDDHHDPHHADNDSGHDDKSGYQQAIETFGHNHADTDVGVMGTQSPKALMKQAIAHMWEAELYLQLSDPIKALPYEELALKYLNQAKKAERIYVKRLGFEPPPVTESRRYQGDLSDILTYEQQQTVPKNDQEIENIRLLLSRLNNLSQPVTNADNELLESIKQQFNREAASRPALMVFNATIERIQLSKSFELADCQACIPELQSELWRQLPAPVAEPNLPQQKYRGNNPIMQRYADFLNQQTRPQ